MFSPGMTLELLHALNHICNDASNYILLKTCELSNDKKSIVSKLIDFMDSNLDEEVNLALNIIGNILSSDDQRVIDHFITYEGLGGIANILCNRNSELNNI